MSIQIKIPEFEDLTAANEWMEDTVNDPCIDNFRATPTSDDDGMIKYDMIRNSGCCGFFDDFVLIGGIEWFIGCNYGH
jgi:hypothetical protein